MADSEVFIAVNVFGTEVTGGHTWWPTKKHNMLTSNWCKKRQVSSKFLRFVKVPSRNIKGDLQLF